MLVCHDLKKDMEPVAPPLPSSMRVIPILFYVAVAGCAFFAAYFMIQKNSAVKARIAQEQMTAAETKKIAQVQIENQALEADLNKAKSMIDWIKGSHALQPLAVTIARSIIPGSNIIELSLSRNVENPWQTQFSIKYNGNDNQQMDETNEALASDYRAISPTVTQDAQSLSYSAILIKQNKL